MDTIINYITALTIIYVLLCVGYVIPYGYKNKNRSKKTPISIHMRRFNQTGRKPYFFLSVLWLIVFCFSDYISLFLNIIRVKI